MPRPNDLNSSIAHRSFNLLINSFETLARSVSPAFYFKLLAVSLDRFDRSYSVDIGGDEIKFRIDSDLVRIRVERMLEREPDTLRWIAGFAKADNFWDIGSNIGIFSLYAAVKSDASVLAFDPLPQNHANIVETIHLNGLADRVWPFCLALSDKTEVSPLSVPVEGDMAGGAGGVFGQTLDNHGSPVDAVKQFPAIGFSIDSFLETFDVPFPTHMKVDIDGIQERVIRGAQTTLRDTRLKTVMIELPPTNTTANRQNFEFITQEMVDAGFDLKLRVSTSGGEPDTETIDTNNFFERRPKQ